MPRAKHSNTHHTLQHIGVVAMCILSLAGCKSERCDTPFGIGGELDLLQPEFINLYHNPGGTLVINRGHKGILINCISLNEYVAFECACPIDHEERMLPDDERRAMTLTCPQCGSRFEVYFGNPLEGSATGCLLYAYSTHFDGRYLSVY